MRELALAYNDTKGEQFARLLKKYEEAKEAAGEERSEQASEANQTIETAASVHQRPRQRRCRGVTRIAAAGP